MLSHDDILASLRRHFPADSAFPERFGVALVAQYAEPALKLPAGRTHVFIPDCHLLTDQDAAVYRNNHFDQDEDLHTLLLALRDLKIAHRGELSVWHLGDLFDVWRARGGRSDTVEIAAIAARYARHLELLVSSPPNGMRARLFAGNHDYVTHKLADWATLRVGIIENEDAAGGDILIVHGDVFDWIENSLPDDLQARVVRAAKLVAAGQTELNHEEREVVAEVNQRLGIGDTPIGISQARLGGIRPEIMTPPGAVNCIEAAAPEDAPVRFYKEAAKVAIELKKNGHDIRTVVIGHTHLARIVRGDRGDGVPFALMDCGSWMGKCRVSQADPWIRSAQLGVISQGEMRIYQLGWREAA